MPDDSTHQGEPKRMTRDKNGELVPQEGSSGPGSPVAGSYAATMLCARAMQWYNENQRLEGEPWPWEDLTEKAQQTWLEKADEFLHEHDAA